MIRNQIFYQYSVATKFKSQRHEIKNLEIILFDIKFWFQFDLGCQHWKRTLIGTVRNSGLFISLPLTGVISDKFGRKRALVMAALMSGIFGLARSFSISYVMMLIFEFFESALGGGINSTSFVLGMVLDRY